jgi:DNA-binding transcriptional LysR family regulator
MTPTARADLLAPQARELIEKAEQLVAGNAPFDPATANRRFRVGAPDAAVSASVPALVERLGRDAPDIGLSMIALLPAPRTTGPEEAWSHVMSMLDGGQLDAAILPYRPQSPRIEARHIHDEEFAVAHRRGHPFGKTGSLSAFAAAGHVLVSATGDPAGLIDRALAEKGMSRRIALTVPHFFMALDVIGRTDLIGAIPRRFAQHHAGAFGLEVADLPLPQPPSPIFALAPKAAMADRGIAWLMDRIAEAGKG